MHINDWRLSQDRQGYRAFTGGKGVGNSVRRFERVVRAGKLEHGRKTRRSGSVHCVSLILDEQYRSSEGHSPSHRVKGEYLRY